MAAVSHQSSRPPQSSQQSVSDPPSSNDLSSTLPSATGTSPTVAGNSYPSSFHSADTTARPKPNSNSSPTTSTNNSRADPRYDFQQPHFTLAAGVPSLSSPSPPPTSSSSDNNRPINGATSSSPVHRQQPHLSTSSTSSSVSKPQKPGGIFAFAAAAFDRTQTALAGISDQKLRPRQSASRLSVGLDSPVHIDQGSVDRRFKDRPVSTFSQSSSSPLTPPESRQQSQKPQLSRDPPSQHYDDTDANRPPPIILPRLDNKMHQTSSRLLRMTDDDRPFTRDFKDLFSTLIVSLLPLSAHRVRLTKVEHTFLSEDAINNLGSLKFSQSNRMPDPKDPSRIVTTTTTTTFSMAKDMARSICQRFVEARFIESADGKYQQQYNMKGSVWQLTSKGICILDRFCSRNGIQQKQVAELIGNLTAQLVILERDGQTDKLVHDRGTIEVIFRRFVGINGFNIKSSVSSADSESLSDYRDGLTGVKMAAERKVNGKTYKDTFTGKAASDWLMDCCTTVDRRETFEMAHLFVEFDLMEPLQMDRTYMAQFPGSALFQPTKSAVYQISAKGRDLLNGSLSRGRASESEGLQTVRVGTARDSNTQRLDRILNDAALRLLFRENLRETHCEENLSFYLDVDDFVRGCRQATRLAQKNPNSTSMDGIKEIMAQAYGIYNAFLAPGSPCELNIDHQLRSNLATRMTKAVGQDVAMIDTLHEVTSLFEDAQNAVFKLMASDSVPKFLRSPKYEQTLKNYDFDSVVNTRIPERSQSRSNRK